MLKEKNLLFCRRMKTRALQCCFGDPFESQGFSLFFIIFITEVTKLAVQSLFSRYTQLKERESERM